MIEVMNMYDFIQDLIHKPPVLDYAFVANSIHG